MMKKHHSLISKIALVLLLLGALNWLIFGLFEMDLVAEFFGDMTMFTRVVYVLFGLGGAYRLYEWIACCHKKKA